jgi:hypothetical protein
MLTAAIAAPKISFDMIFVPLRVGQQRCFVVDVQKVGLRGRIPSLFNLSIAQSSIVPLHAEARRIAANFAKLKEPLRRIVRTKKSE